MPNARTFITPFINASLLKDAPLKAPIDRVEEKELDGSMKLVMFVAGLVKGLPLNVVNTNTLCDRLGDNTDDWIGAEVELYSDRCQFKGKMVNCVRVRFPQSE